MMQSPLNYVTLATTPPPSSCRRLPYRAVVKLRGHLKPLGQQSVVPREVEVVESFPDPETFYRNYVHPRRPVLFRRAQQHAPALKLWSQDSYLKEMYGNVDVLYEPKRESRLNDPRRMRLDDFLQYYNNTDMYVVSQTPTAMLREVYAPRCLLCGSISRSIEESNIWISSGSTRSMLHHDSDNIINCLISGGEKQWLLLDTSFKKVGLGFKWTEEGWIASDSSPVDPDHVNLLNFPGFQHVPWERATVQPGDCIYLPAQYLHQVRTDSTRSVALSVMFLKEEVYPHDNKGCDLPLPPPNTTMATLNFTWMYNGSGPVLMGYISPHVLRADLISSIREHAVDSSETVPYKVARGILEKVEPDTAVADILKALGVTETSGLSVASVQKLTANELKALAFMIDLPHDAVNEPPDMLGFDEHAWPPTKNG